MKIVEMKAKTHENPYHQHISIAVKLYARTVQALERKKKKNMENGYTDA